MDDSRRSLATLEAGQVAAYRALLVRLLVDIAELRRSPVGGHVAKAARQFQTHITGELAAVDRANDRRRVQAERLRRG